MESAPWSRILRTAVAPAALACAAVVPAGAADVVVRVADAGGKPIAGAVAMLEPVGGQGIGAWQAPPAVMAQKGVLFSPFVLPVRVGARVSFPNLDDIRHHVYSFSPARRFELRLYGKDETKTEVFDKAGVVALGCNIHDNMLSFIYVTDCPVYAVTDSLGEARFAGLAAGPWRAHFWHPDAAGQDSPARDLALVEGGSATIAAAVELRAVRRRQLPPREGGYR